MKDATALAKRQELGAVPSFSRLSVRNDNPYSESAVKTLKYVPSYPGKPLETIERTREWVRRFVTGYNTARRHSSIRFVASEQRHEGTKRATLKVGEAVFNTTKRAILDDTLALVLPRPSGRR